MTKNLLENIRKIIIGFILLFIMLLLYNIKDVQISVIAEVNNFTKKENHFTESNIALSERSEEECIQFLLNNEVEIPSDFSDLRKENENIRKLIKSIEENPTREFIYNYSVTQDFAESTRTAVINYYRERQKELSVNAALSNTGLQDNTVYGEWDDNYSNYNCYSYAINYTEGNYMLDRYRHPGQMSGKEFSMQLPIETMANLVKEDLISIGCYNVKVTNIRPSTIENVENLICIRKGEMDYHFMKYHPKGNYWTHKPGATAVLKYNYQPSNDRVWEGEAVNRWGVTQFSKNTYDSEIYYIVYSNYLTTRLINGQLAIMGVKTDVDFSGDVILPSEIVVNGSVCPIVKIENYAFSYQDKLTRVEIPAGIDVADNAFYGCVNLSDIVLDSNTSHKTGGLGTSFKDWVTLEKLSMVDYSHFYDMGRRELAVTYTSYFDIFGTVEYELALTDGADKIYSSKSFKPGDVDHVETVTFTVALANIPVDTQLFVEIRYRKTNPLWGGDFTVTGRNTEMEFRHGNNTQISNGMVIIDNNVTAFFTPRGFNGHLVIPEGVTKINDGAFKLEGSEKNGLVSVRIPSSLTHIGAEAFSYSDDLARVEIAENSNLISIGESAFLGCRALETINLPRALQSIGDFGFNDCRKLKSVFISDNVTKIGNYAFDMCKSLSSVYYYGNASEWNKIAIGSGNSELKNAERYYYSTSKPTAAGSYWCYVNGIPAAWPSAILWMGLSANGSSNLVTTTQLTFTFSADPGSALQEMDITVTGASKGLLDGSGTTRTLNIHSISVRNGDRVCVKIETASDSPLIGDTKYVKVYTADINGLIYDPIDSQQAYEVSVGWSLSYGGTVNIPATYSGWPVVKIADYGFYGCSDLLEINMSEAVNLSDIGEYAFYGCTGLECVVIPANVSFIGSYAFGECSNLRGVSITGNSTGIDNDAFYSCNERFSISISELVFEANYMYAFPSECTIYVGEWIDVYDFVTFPDICNVIVGCTFSEDNSYLTSIIYNPRTIKTPIAPPCRNDGYLFMGFALEEDGEVVYDEYDLERGNLPEGITLYAVWD